MRNHTGTHLLHAALRNVLGEKYTNPVRSGLGTFAVRLQLPRALRSDELLQIEALVNRYIASEYPVHKQKKDAEEAKAEGAIALFGEKYGSEVRTIETGPTRKGFL